MRLYIGEKPEFVLEAIFECFQLDEEGTEGSHTASKPPSDFFLLLNGRRTNNSDGLDKEIFSLQVGNGGSVNLDASRRLSGSSPQHQESAIGIISVLFFRAICCNYVSTEFLTSVLKLHSLIPVPNRF